MIEISGLTERQVKLLNVMWSIESSEELEDWLISLDDELRQECTTLGKLIIYATVDKTVEIMSVYPEASKVINQIMDKK